MTVPWMEAALAAAGDASETLLDVYQRLTTNPDYQLWVSDAGMYVTHVVPGRDGPLLHFWLAGGTMTGMKELYPLAEAFGRQLGCVAMTLIGRCGWQRTFLRDEGWSPALVEMRKGLQ